MMWIILLVVLAVLIIWFIATYNGFVSLKNKVEEAFSTMDVYLVKRYDLIPNLVETVKGYAAHEKETLEKVVSARSLAMNAHSMDEKIAQEQNLSGLLGRLLAISESYPDLKANTNFIDLQRQLKDMEGEIANARKYYNGVVKAFNTRTETIPSNLIAGICGFKKMPLFVVKDEAQRENVKVSEISLVAIFFSPKMQ